MRRQLIIFLITVCCIVFLAMAFRAVRYGRLAPLTNPVRLAAFDLRQEKDAKRWRYAFQLNPASEALTNAVASLVETNAAQVEVHQRLALQRMLTSWFYAASTGKYDDYVAFRQPDYIRFEANSLMFLHGVLNGKVPDLDALTDRAKCALLYDHFNNITMQSVPSESLSLTSSRVRSHSEFLNNATERHRYLKEHYFGGWAEYQSASPFRYNVNQEDVLEKHGLLHIAYFHARLITQTYVVPVHITFFWSPDEARWKPFEFRLSTQSPAPIEGMPPPQLFF